MTTYPVYLRIPTHEVIVVTETNQFDTTNFVLIGEFSHDPESDSLGYVDNHVVWHHVRDLLYKRGITDVNAYKIMLTYPLVGSDTPPVDPTDPDAVLRPLSYIKAIANEGAGTSPLGPTNPWLGGVFHGVAYEDLADGSFQAHWFHGAASAGFGEWSSLGTATVEAVAVWIDNNDVQHVTDLLTAQGAKIASFEPFTKGKLFGTEVRPKLGSHYWIHFRCFFPNGGYLSHARADYANGEALTYGANVAAPSATPYTNTWAGGGDYYGPCFVGGNCKNPTFGVSGDSNHAGVLASGIICDVPDTLDGGIGSIARHLLKNMAGIDVSIPGGTAAEMADPTKFKFRDSLLAQTDVILPALGTNDLIFNSGTAAQLAANIQTAKARQKNKLYLYPTIPVVVVSATNNTPYDAVRDLERKAYNANLRASASTVFDIAVGTEDGTTGKAKDLTDIVDGAHWNAKGNKKGAAGTGFDVLARLGANPVNMGMLLTTGDYLSKSLSAWTIRPGAAKKTNNVYSPEHKLTAIDVRELAANNDHSVQFTPALVLANTTKEFSVSLKRTSGARNAVIEIGKNGGNYAATKYLVKLNTGEISRLTGNDGTDAVHVAMSTSLDSEGFWRAKMTVQFGANMPANPFLFVKMANNDAGNVDYVGDDTSSIAIWGFRIGAPTVDYVAPFSYPAKGAKYHLDFAGQRYTGGIQPDDTLNANDGRFFKQLVTPATPYYAERLNGSLRRYASGTALRITDRGLLVEPQVDYTTRALYSNNLANAAWVADGITAVNNQTSRSDVANSGTRLTATKDNATIKQATVYATSSVQTMRADIKRVSGTGKIYMSIDDVTYTEVVLDKPRYNGWGRYSIPAQTLVDPKYCFRMEKSGDVIDVAFVTSDHLPFETSPFDTTNTVRRKPYDRPSTSIQGGTTTPTSSGLMDFLATATEWGVYMEWDSMKPDHFLFGQILRPFADGSVRFSTDDTDVKSVKSATGLTRLTVDARTPLKNKAIGWVKDGKCYLSVNGSNVIVSANVGAGAYTALDHKDIGSNGAGSVNMSGCVQQLVIFDTAPTEAEAKLWTTL